MNKITDYLKNVKWFEKNYLQSIGGLLYSIRLDWTDEKSVLARARAAVCLCDMLIKYYNDEKEKKSLIVELEETIQEYIDTVEEALNGMQFLEIGVVIDGRYFRNDFPNGYIGIRPHDFGEIEEDE